MTFVGHDASRTGAPTVLRSLLRWAGSERRPRPRLVLLRGGPLVDDLRRCATTRVLDGGPGRVAELGVHGLRAVWPRLPRWAEVAPLGRTIRSGRPDVVVASSLASLEPAVRATDGRCPVVCHVHELDAVADRVLPPAGADRDAILAAVARFVAAGPAVRSMLVDRWGIDAGRVDVVDEFIDLPAVADHEVARARAELGLDPDAVVVASAGMAGHRKGTDLFLDLVAAIGPHRAPPEAVWVGGDPSTGPWAEAVHDAEAAGLGDRVRLVPTRADALAIVATADVFVTTAREDPYPLVTLEAGALGLPVVGFAAGGFADLTADAGLPDAATAVGDVLGLAELVEVLLESQPERRRRGDALGAWVRSTHLTEHLAPRLWDSLSAAA
jgi:glycosyltransferase involved in cell wall biosynthesis